MFATTRSHAAQGLSEQRERICRRFFCSVMVNKIWVVKSKTAMDKMPKHAQEVVHAHLKSRLITRSLTPKKKGDTGSFLTALPQTEKGGKVYDVSIDYAVESVSEKVMKVSIDVEVLSKPKNLDVFVT